MGCSGIPSRGMHSLKEVLELMDVSSVEYQLDPTNPELKSAGFDANLRTLDDPVVLSMEW